MGGRAIEQRALTVVATLAGGDPAPLLSALDAAKDRVLASLALVTTLHFGRFVVFTQASGGSALAFESNYDGDEEAHLTELLQHVGDDLDAFFGHCEGYARGAFADLARRCSRTLRPRAYYVAHGGLSVAQITHDARVRDAIEAWLDDADRAGDLSKRRPVDVAAGVKAHLAQQGLAVGHVDRGLPREPFAQLRFYGAIVTYFPIVATLASVAALRYEPADRKDERLHPPELESDHSPRLEIIVDAEDASPQNGLTHVVPLKPGRFRRLAVSVVLSFVERARKTLCFRGNLSGIESIHFARWVLLDDGTLVFFSNYDGSWESYLGDFVDKAHIFLTGIWSNTKWFPDTRFLVWGGASSEATFKQWTRTFQVRNPIWYSAYPTLTVSNVLRNASIRELAGTPLSSDREARSFLSLL